MHRSVLATLFLVVSVIVTAPSAAEIDPPAPALAVELTNTNLDLDLANLDIGIVVSELSDPEIRASIDGIDVDPRTLVDIAADEGTTTVRMLNGDDGPSIRPESKIELVVTPTTTGRIVASGGVVSISVPEEEIPESEDTEEPPQTVTTPPLEVDLSNATLMATTITPKTVTAVNTTISFNRTRGRPEFNLDGCSLDMVHHAGPVSLASIRGHVSLDHFRGLLTTELHDTKLLADTISSKITAAATGSELRLDRCNGPVVVSGADSTVVVNGGRTSTISVKGPMMKSTVGRVRASLNIAGTGGQFDGTEIHGNLTLNLVADARASVIDLIGVVKLGLQSNSSVRIDGDRTVVNGQIRNSTAVIERAKSLSLQATGSTLTVGRVSRITTLTASASSLDLDLSESGQQIPLSLQNRSTADIRMTSPCQVGIKGRRPGLGSGIEIQGCVIRGKSRKVRVGTLDGRQPQVLEVKIDGSSTMTVTDG